MTPGSEWWSKVKQAREASASAHTRHVAWTLRLGTHTADLELRDVPTVGIDVALVVDGDLRRSRLYRSYEQDALADEIAATRASFEAKGWA